MLRMLTVSSIVLLISALGCSKDQEMENLSQAQACLDEVPDSNPQSANSCLQYTAGYTDSRAMELNCSIYLTAGGLTADRMESAYTASQASGATHGQADYIAYLALTLPDSTTALTNVQSAATYCSQSGDSSLEFVASMSIIGTAINYEACSNGTCLDLSGSATDVDSGVQTAVAACQTSPSSTACNLIGPATSTAASSYCSSASANQLVCGTINSAVAQYGNNPTTLTAALTCELEGKTFDGTNCN